MRCSFAFRRPSFFQLDKSNGTKLHTFSDTNTKYNVTKELPFWCEFAGIICRIYFLSLDHLPAVYNYTCTMFHFMNLSDVLVPLPHVQLLFHYIYTHIYIYICSFLTNIRKQKHSIRFPYLKDKTSLQLYLHNILPFLLPIYPIHQLLFFTPRDLRCYSLFS